MKHPFLLSPSPWINLLIRLLYLSMLVLLSHTFILFTHSFCTELKSLKFWDQWLKSPSQPACAWSPLEGFFCSETGLSTIWNHHLRYRFKPCLGFRVENWNTLFELIDWWLVGCIYVRGIKIRNDYGRLDQSLKKQSKIKLVVILLMKLITGCWND